MAASSAVRAAGRRSRRLFDIFVAEVPWTVSSKELKEYFSQFGTKIQAFTNVIAGLNFRLNKMFRMCFRRTPTYLKVPSSLSNSSPVEDAVKERIKVSERWKESLFH
ncbi:SRA stem-loop-interacting RNA-binding protein, mitochondrial isoform 2-T2 [Theristicus caerulescens]